MPGRGYSPDKDRKEVNKNRGDDVEDGCVDIKYHRYQELSS